MNWVIDDLAVYPGCYLKALRCNLRLCHGSLIQAFEARLCTRGHRVGLLQAGSFRFLFSPPVI